jgi:hypothetical protein
MKWRGRMVPLRLRYGSRRAPDGLRKDSISLGADKRTFPIYETSIIARCLVAKKQSNEAQKEIKPDRPPLGG